ncbi:hypothetical protein VaNZ11_002522 [Volvox africanus]|uniref:Uncharacterized protein n=1 Tax=Volvox africanus TaxID=51714 RepID=A0ABQ5RTT5_9CHLO|nr:hypothetical protein VaNZ11_002522 [Volvox africanus]
MGKDEDTTKVFFGRDDYVTVTQVVNAHLERKLIDDTISDDEDVLAAIKPNDDKLARGTIKKYILPEDLLQFAGNTTARDLWVALAKKHIPNVRNFRMQIQQQLKDFEMLSGESIDDYFRRFYKIGYKASLISMKIEPEDALLHLIRGLSSDYDGVKSVLRHMESIESVDQLQDMLKTEEGELRLQRNKAREVSLMSLSRTHDGARVGPSQGAGAGNADGGRSRKACLYCNKEGHFIAECRKKANDEQRGIWRPALKGLRQKPRNPPALAAPPPAPPPVAPVAQPPAAAQAAAPPRPAQGQRRQLIARVYSSQQDDWERELWLFDTGAEVHVTGDKDKLRNYQHCGSDCKVWLKTANGSVVRPEGHGRVMFRSSCFETDVEVDVYHAPGIMGHILSLKALEGSFGPNVVPQFSGVLPHVEIGGAPAIELEKIDGLFYAEDSSYDSWMGRYGSDRCLSGKKVREELRKVKLAITKQDSNLGVLWHKRYGHLGFDALAKVASSDMVTGFGASVDDVVAAKGQFCKPCAEGKQTRQPHPSTGNVTSKRLDLVHMDLCGPLPVKSWNNAKYWVTFYDDCTKFSEVRCITDKTVVPETVKEVIKLWERQTGDKVRRIHTDRGLEYVNEELASTLRDMGIFHEKTAPYTPQQNGAAERLNRTLEECVRTMLADSGLPQEMWSEAVITANTLRNVSPTKGSNLTPWERFIGEKPDVSKLRVFGCPAYVMIPKQQRHKLDPVSVPGQFVGYAPGMSAWRVWIPKDRRVRISCDVKFDEWGVRGSMEFDASESEEEDVSGSDPEADEGNEIQEESPPEQPPEPAPQPEPELDVPIALRKSQRQNTKYAKSILGVNVDIPATYEEAIASPLVDFWIEAMEEEFASLQEKGTWSLVEKPADKQALGVKWVYSVKLDKHGVVERFKARLVVKGFMQREGVDFEEVFAPVSKHSTLRVFLAMVAADDMELHQLDVKTAFLNGDLEEEIYTVQPPGFESGGPGLVCRLHKALYGLRQASRAWNKTLHEKLIQMGFEVSNADPSLYIRRDLDGQICTYLLVYVDDVLIASHDEQTVLEVKEEIKQLYECRDMGEAEVFLGLVIKRDRETRTLTVSQEHMIHELIERYGMVNADPRSIPMSPGMILMRAADGEVLDRSRYPYIELVGSLMYITNCTRPDIAQAVGVLTRHMSAPTEQHWRAAKAVVRFSLATPQCGIVFGGERVEEGLIGYTDSDYAGCIESCKSTGGYVFTLHGGSVSWSSRLQRTVTSSTMEAEYVAASEATKEALWLRLLLSELGYSLRPTTINCDSQSAIKITKNPVISGKSKHIAVRYHMVREQVARGAVVMEDCRSDDMVADILTKPLPLEKFAKHQKSMGVCKI